MGDDLAGDGYIVCGGNGFLGETLIEELRKKSSAVFSADNQGGGKAYNLASPPDVEAAFLDFNEQFPQVTRLHLVVATGATVFTDTLDRNPREIEKVLSTNLTIPILCLNQFAKHRNQAFHPGSAVLVSSVFGHKVPNFDNYRFLDRRNSEVYGASKAGVDQLTRYYAKLLGPKGIRVNSVAPGGIYDPEVHPPLFQRAYATDTALGRMTERAEVVSAVIFLLSEMSSGITGQVLSVDAGFGL